VIGCTFDQGTYIGLPLSSTSEYADEYGEDYAMYRMTSILGQAIDKFYKYKEDKDNAFELIDNAEPDAAVSETMKQDWLAYNSPFHILNERFALTPDANFRGDQPAHKKSPPKISEVDDKGRPMYVPWSKVHPITGKKIKTRVGGKYLQDKAKNKYEDGTLTGLINSEYTEWEKEYFEKAYPAEQRNEYRRLSGLEPNVPVPPTQFGYLKWRLENQQRYLGMFPYHLTRDLRWYNMLDISKSLEESLNEVGVFYKFKLLPQLIWDNVVKTMSTPYINKFIARLDLVTQEVKKSYDPGILSDTLNKKGLGDLKTDDPKYYDQVVRNAALEFAFRADVEDNLRIIQFLWKHGGLTNPGQITEEGQKKGTTYVGALDKEAFDWTVDKMIYDEQRDLFFSEEKSKEFKQGDIPIEKLHSSETTILGIPGSERYKLTKNERDRLKRLNARRKELYGLLNVALAKMQSEEKEDQVSAKQLEAYRLELKSVAEDMAKIVRISTPVNKLEVFESYMRMKFMGYNVWGRVMDTVSTSLIGNMSEALDGRIIDIPSFIQGFTTVFPYYGLGYIGSGAATYAGVSLAGGLLLHSTDLGEVAQVMGNVVMPVSTLTALKIAGVAGGASALINNVVNKKGKMKLDQMMQLFGALDTFETLTAEEIRDIVSKKMQLFTPLGLASVGEMFNKATTVASILHKMKIKDKNGKNRPMWDAFVIGEDDFLRWNTEEFGAQKDHEMELVGQYNKKMLDIRSKMETGVKRVHGDYSRHLPKLAKKTKGFWQIMTFMRNYIGQFAIVRWGGDWTDQQSGLKYTGRYRAPFKMLSKYRAGEGVPDYYKAAGRQLMMDAVVLGGILAAGMLIKAALDSDPFHAADDTAFTALNLINKGWQDQTQVFNPNTFKSRSLTGINPYMTTFFQAWDVLEAVGKALADKDHNFVEADKMTQAELNANHLSPENQPLFNYNVPKYDSWFGDYPDNEVKKYLDINTGEVTDSRFAKVSIENSQSRIAFRLSRMFPALSAYRSQENMKKTNNLLNKK